MSDTFTNNRFSLFGLSQPTSGVLFGIGLFLVAVIFFWITKVTIGFVVLLSPGLFTRFMMSPWIGVISNSVIQDITSYTVIFGTSIIPPAILGLLITSNEKKERTNGIIMLVMYFIIILVLGIPMSAIFSD